MFSALPPCYICAVNPIELQLPAPLQSALEARATAHARTVEDEARALLKAALQDGSESDDQLDQLVVLEDAQLWALAKRQVSAEKSERMQELAEQRQAEGLSPAEAEEVLRLQHFAQRLMLLRAEAAALLKRRGHDVSGLHSQF